MTTATKRGYVFKCVAKRTGDLVQIILDKIHFTVRMSAGAPLASIELPNGVIVALMRSTSANTITVQLCHGSLFGQRVRLRKEEPRKLAINGLSSVEENNERHLAARRIHSKDWHVLHVSILTRIVGDKGKDLEFKDGTAWTYQTGTESQPYFHLQFFESSATDEDVAAALLGADSHFRGVPRGVLGLALKAFTSLKAAKEIVDQMGTDIFANPLWIYQFPKHGMESLLVSLLAVHGPELVRERLTGEAEAFFNCFQFPDTWTEDGRSWKERLQETPRNPWAYIASRYAVRGVKGNPGQVFLWVSGPQDATLENEVDFYDSDSDKFPWFIQQDLQFLLSGKMGSELNIVAAIPQLISEPLIQVVGWHKTPASIEWARGWQGKKGILLWDDALVGRGRSFAIERQIFSPTSLTQLGGSFWLISDSFDVEGGLEVLDVQQLWQRGQLEIVSENPFQHNLCFSVIQVLADGAHAGIMEGGRLVADKNAKLILLVCNGEGDHIVVSYDPASKASVKMVSARTEGAPLRSVAGKPTEKRVPPQYRLLFRGKKNFRTFSCQGRREHVFVQKIGV